MSLQHPISLRYTVAAALLSLCVLGSATAVAQDVKATVQIETAGQSAMTMDYWTGDNSIRIDMAQPQEMSIIWNSGDAPGLLMIQHGDRRYMEFGDAQFQMMRQMMQRVGGAGNGGSDSSSVDLASLRFEPTGQTETIGQWSATGVRVTGLGQGQDGVIWVAPDLDSGLFELFARMGDALQAIQMPMLGGGANGPQQQLMRYRQMKDASGLPDGGVVRLNADVTITLLSLEQGPFAGDPFAPPTGYEKMQMPNIPE